MPDQAPVDVDAQLGDALTLLDGLDPTEDATLEDLGNRLTQVLYLAAQARELRNLIEAQLIDSMPEDSLSMGDVTVVKERTTRSSWKPAGAARMREDIAHAVATKLSTDVATGDVDPERRNLMVNAIKEVWTVVPSFSSMLKEGRQRYGLAIGEYRDFSDGWNINVIVNEEEG